MHLERNGAARRHPCRPVVRREVRLVADGVTSRFFKRDGKYFINTQGEDGKNHDYEVRYTFGYFPLQQYLIELPGGRLQPLQIAWDDARKLDRGKVMSAEELEAVLARPQQHRDERPGPTRAEPQRQRELRAEIDRVVAVLGEYDVAVVLG